MTQFRVKRDLHFLTVKETLIEREVRDQDGSERLERREEEIGRWQANKQAQQAGQVLE